MAMPIRNIVTIAEKRISARHLRPSSKWPRPGTIHAATHNRTKVVSLG